MLSQEQERDFVKLGKIKAGICAERFRDFTHWFLEHKRVHCQIKEN